MTMIEDTWVYRALQIADPVARARAALAIYAEKHAVWKAARARALAEGCDEAEASFRAEKALNDTEEELFDRYNDPRE